MAANLGYSTIGHASQARSGLGFDGILPGGGAEFLRLSVGQISLQAYRLRCAVRTTMRGNISLGRVLDIPLRLHYTWFIIFVLVTVSLVLNPLVQPPYPPMAQRIILGILTSLLFFTSIVNHELAHSLLAIRNHLPVKEITLFVFGGVSQITKEATNPRAELLIAIVGPLTSLALAGIFYGLILLLAGGEQNIAGRSLAWASLVK